MLATAYDPIVCHTRSMSTAKELHEIKYADRLDTGMVIVFTDGKHGLFGADLLYEMLPRSEPLPEADSGTDGDDQQE